MRLRLLNSPSKSVCYAAPSDTCEHAWAQLRQMRGELVLVRNGDEVLGALLPAQVRAQACGCSSVGELPLREVTVLPARARTSEVLQALSRDEVEAVLLADGSRYVSVILREPRTQRAA